MENGYAATMLYLAVDVVPTTTSLSLEIPKGDDSILQEVGGWVVNGETGGWVGGWEVTEDGI